jgi:hypothetical protein
MAERNCGFGDCADHYGDNAAWCLRCRGLLDNDRRGDADDILSLQQLLAEHGYDIAGDTLTDCVRVVLLDKAKSSELLAQYVNNRPSVPITDGTTCLYPLTCPCDNDKPDPCPKCGARV